MKLRCVVYLGMLLIAVALVAVPSSMVIESYVGGSAVHGHVENGKYFVNPSHGQPVVEVSETTWRTVYWVERVWPFSALAPGLVGLFLVALGRADPSRKPLPTPTEAPEWVLWACLAGSGVVVGGAGLSWVAFRLPWVTMIVGWVLICITVGTLSWAWMRSLSRPRGQGSLALEGQRRAQE